MPACTLPAFSFKMCKKYILAFGRFQSMWDWWTSSSVSPNTSNLGVILVQALGSWFVTPSGLWLHLWFCRNFFSDPPFRDSDLEGLLGILSTERPCDICAKKPSIYLMDLFHLNFVVNLLDFCGCLSTVQVPFCGTSVLGTLPYRSDFASRLKQGSLHHGRIFLLIGYFSPVAFLIWTPRQL